MGKKEPQNRFKQKFFRFSTKNEGSMLKIFGDELNPSISCQTLLLSNKDTAEWIVKQMLFGYGLKHENPQNYCLIQITIPIDDRRPIEQIVLRETDCPLNIYLNRSLQDSIVFKIVKHPLEQFRHRCPMFIEVDTNGQHLLVPRLFQIYSHRIDVGCRTKTEIPRQYFYINDIGIEENHCLITYENGCTRLIPKNGQNWLNGKLISKEFILQHGMIICFGQQSNFRFYDEQSKHAIRNTNQLTMYSSLPILPSKTTTTIERKSPSIKKVNVLPALLEVRPEMEKRFLQSVFYDYPLQNIHFRLIPVYTIYLTIRQRLSPYDRSQLSLHEKQTSVLSFLSLIKIFFKNKIQECQNHAAYLAYWLANLSELIFFLQQDRDLTQLSYNFQLNFIRYLQQIFINLIRIFANELIPYLFTFTTLERTTMNVDQRTSTELRWIFDSKKSSSTVRLNFNDILEIFASIIDLLRKCRVNAGLTIEIFSQLFHYINAYLFNFLLEQPEFKSAEFVVQRLTFIEQWAFNEGLERPYQCHLLKLNQLCEILRNNKNNLHDIERIISMNSFQLNSKQVQQLLKFYRRRSNEPPISPEFRDNLLAMAYEDVDKNLLRQGFPVNLFEDKYLNIPFYLPENGFSCETVCGVPRQLQDFILSMKQSGLCRLFTNAYSLGYWTQFLQLENNDSSNEQVETIFVNKTSNSFGLIIVCIKNQFQQSQGIFIKDILPTSAAYNQGHLQIGDRILSANQINLKTATEHEAVEALKQSGPSVTLRVMKNAADQYGFSELFRKPIQRTVSFSPINYRKTELSPRTEEEYKEKLKRRLEQFEYERAMEQEYNRQMSMRRQSERENHLRQERERELRADQDIEQYRRQRLSLQDRLNDAEREQNRLLKHICPPNKTFSRDQSK